MPIAAAGLDATRCSAWPGEAGEAFTFIRSLSTGR
jgi:hypothetical protein